MTIGPRTVVAASCLRCGALRDGTAFRRHRRNRRDRIAYIDLRCGECRWKLMEAKSRA